jgi:hypothetical protein
MTATQRKLLLFTLLAASAAAVAWDRLHRPAPQISAAVPRQPMVASSSQAPRASEALAVSELRPRTGYLGEGKDAFPPLHPSVPATAAVVATPASEPRPTPPPIPFNVIGKKFDSGRWEVYLAKGDATYIATQGAVIADNYRVESIAPTEMTLVFLPLNEQQTLQTGALLNE